MRGGGGRWRATVSPLLAHLKSHHREGRSRGGRTEEKVFSFVKKKKFYRSICLVVLTATVVSECIDGGQEKFKGYVLYCFGGAVS